MNCLFHGGPIENLWFKEDAGILIPDAREQEPLGLGRAARDHDLQAGRVGEVGLGRLGVVQRPATQQLFIRVSAPGRDTDPWPTAPQVARKVRLPQSKRFPLR